MNKIYVKSQAELDAIPLNYEGVVYIEFGSVGTPARIKNSYIGANFYAYGSAAVEVYGSASVDAYDSVIVCAFGSAAVRVHDSARARAFGSTTVDAYGSASAEAYGSSKVYAHDSVTVCAYESAEVYAYKSAKVCAYGFATVKASGSATVYAYDFVRVLDRTVDHQVKAVGDAYIVYYPQTIDDYIRHYAIESDGKTCHLFKAVHKRDGKYVSDFWKSLEYKLGETARADGLCTDVGADCGTGIHLSHLRYAIEFGKGWNDLAILELEAENDKIIVPLGNPGKVRTLEAKVIREVPYDEWSSIYG